MNLKTTARLAVAVLPFTSTAALAHPGHGIAADGTMGHIIDHIVLVVPIALALAIAIPLLRGWLARRNRTEER